MRLPWERKRDGRDTDLDEEIRAHLAMSAADRIARGELPHEARAAARREFGNVAHVKEVTREAWGGVWLERLTQDVRYAVRSLRHAPVFATVAILTLALGIGANTAMFTVVRGILLRPLPFGDPKSLFAVSHVPDRAVFFVGPSMTDREFVDYRRLTKAFQATTTFITYPATLLGAGDPVRLATAGVASNFFSVLGVPPRLGRGFADGEELDGTNAVAVISADLWRTRFGADSSVLHRVVTIEGYRKRIVGVMPESFSFPSGTQVWVPHATTPNARNSRLQMVIGRLTTGASATQALTELRAFVADRERGQDSSRLERSTTAILPLRDLIVGDVGRSLWLFSGAVGLVLLIACTNVSNLMLMRATTRRHELAVRSALGASQSRLVRQMLTESVVVAMAGGAIGLVVAATGVRLLVSAAPPSLLSHAAEIHIDPVVLGVMLLTCIGAGVGSGMAPALGGARRDVRESLGDNARATSRAPLRALLVTAEASLAFLLLVGAGLLLRSFAHLRSVELGFAAEHVVTATVDLPTTRYPTPALMHDVQRRMSAQIAAIPGVRSSASVNWLPLTTTLIMGDFALEDRRPLPPDYTVIKPCVTPEYFATMGIHVRRGRGFLSSDDHTSAHVAVISESVARRFWPNGAAVGQRITMEDHPTPSDWITIVGVVDDVVQANLADARGGAIYRPLAQVDQVPFIEHLTFVASAAIDPSSVATSMRAAVRAVDPQQPIESIMTMEARLGATVAEPRFRTLVLVVFSSLALVLAAIGIYGVLAYSVTERTRELGIRIALGASPAAAEKLVLGGTARLVVPGLLLGAVAAMLVARVLTTFLFQVRPTDPATFAGAGVVLLAVALGAGYAPARRASRIDPVIAMK